MRIIISLLVVIFLVSCEVEKNEHKRFVNGATISIEQYLDGVFVNADTSGDGVADVRAKVVGNTGSIKFRGDSVSLNIGTNTNFATPFLKAKEEKSKQDSTELE